MRFRTSEMQQVKPGERGAASTLEEGNDSGRIVTIQSLSNAQLIQILQHHDNDELTQVIEEELARRKTDGAPLQ
jgi:hypothetical protein